MPETAHQCRENQRLCDHRGNAQCSDEDGNLVERKVDHLSEIEKEARVLAGLREVGEKDHDGETKETRVCASLPKRLCMRERERERERVRDVYLCSCGMCV